MKRSSRPHVRSEERENIQIHSQFPSVLAEARASLFSPFFPVPKFAKLEEISIFPLPFEIFSFHSPGVGAGVVVKTQNGPFSSVAVRRRHFGAH